MPQARTDPGVFTKSYILCLYFLALAFAPSLDSPVIFLMTAPIVVTLPLCYIHTIRHLVNYFSNSFFFLRTCEQIASN